MTYLTIAYMFGWFFFSMHRTSIEIQTNFLSTENNYLIFHMVFIVTTKTSWKKAAIQRQLQINVSSFLQYEINDLLWNFFWLS